MGARLPVLVYTLCKVDAALGRGTRRDAPGRARSPTESTRSPAKLARVSRARSPDSAFAAYKCGKGGIGASG
jgi:hypothetical protein